MLRFLFITMRAIDSDSSATIRNRAMINGLLCNGNSVDVLTSTKCKDPNLFPEGSLLRIIYLDEANKASTNLHSYIKKIKGFLYKIKKTFTLYDSSKKYVKNSKMINYSDYDYIISSSDPKSSHLFVYYHRKEIQDLEKKWIQIWGDPFALDITEKSIFRFAKVYEEKKLIKHSFKTFYVSPFTLLEQQKKYKQYANKMEYTFIPFLKEHNYSNSLRKELRILYAGDYYKSVRNILPLVDAINGSDFHLTIFGETDLRINSNQNILVKGRTSKNVIEEQEKDADVLVQLSNLKGTQIPGKIYQLLGTNKTILFICEEDKKIKKLFSPYDRFVFCDNNKDDILEKLYEISSGKYVRMNRVVNDFSPQRIMENFECKILDDNPNC